MGFGLGWFWVGFGWRPTRQNPIGDRAQGFVSRIQKHLQSTSGRYYNVRPGRRDATVAEEVVILIYGKVLDYPSSADIDQVKRKETVLEWVAQFSRPSRTDVTQWMALVNNFFV